MLIGCQDARIPRAVAIGNLQLHTTAEGNSIVTVQRARARASSPAHIGSPIDFRKTSSCAYSP
jgi:hypothetical protein